MDTKIFTVPDVVSALRGVLVNERGMDAVYEILSFLHDRSLYTHELPQAMKPALDWVATDFPWLTELDTSSVNRETWREWIDAIVSAHPEPLELTKISWSSLKEKSPFDTLREMVPNEKIIVVQV